MLVLSRRLGEEIVIASAIRIRVVAIQRNRIRLAVCAPPTVRVDRLEVHERRARQPNPGKARGESVAS